VMITGLWSQYQARALASAETQVPLATTEQESKAIL